jgi:hypothetical protein
MPVYVYVCMYMYMYVRTCMYARAHVCVWMCVSICRSGYGANVSFRDLSDRNERGGGEESEGEGSLGFPPCLLDVCVVFRNEAKS